MKKQTIIVALLLATANAAFAAAPNESTTVNVNQALRRTLIIRLDALQNRDLEGALAYVELKASLEDPNYEITWQSAVRLLRAEALLDPVENKAHTSVRTAFKQFEPSK